jgi:FHA domain
MLSESATQAKATVAAESTSMIEVVLQVGPVTRAIAPGRYLVSHTGLCGLGILDPSVEARHPQLVITDAARIVDLRGRGTYVNGERVCGFRRLSNGDRLRVGSRVFTVWLRPLQRAAPKTTREHVTGLPALNGGPAQARSDH